MKLARPPLQRLANHVDAQYGHFDEELCEVVGQPVDVAFCVDCHQKSYLGGRPAYECENFKRLYILRYLFAHVVQTQQPLKHATSYFAAQPNIRALSLGGGPGTEAIALMDVLRNLPGPFRIVFDNFDSERSWQPFYYHLVSQFAGYLKEIKTNASFSPTEFHASRFPNSIAAYDIVFVSWLLSELGRTSAPKELLKEAQQATRPGGYLIVTDRIEGPLIGQIEGLLPALGECSVVGLDLNCERNIGIDLTEEWKTTFEPKLTCRTAYWVLCRNAP